MRSIMAKAAMTGAAIVGFVLGRWCLAGAPQKWGDLPKAVQDAVVANGGTAGMSVDKEPGQKNGLDVYEAGVKDKNGNVDDLVITSDGKLVETKTDDAADLVAERQARATKVLAGVKFTHPNQITNPYVPLSLLKQDILDGSEDNVKTHVERSPRPDIHKMFSIGDQTIEALTVEDRDYDAGQLSEVTLDYFAQDDNGTVYYLGEDVDEYKDGKVVGHDGGWSFGKDTPAPGVLFPAHPKVGQKFWSEDVSSDITEKDEVMSDAEPMTMPGTNVKVYCVKVKESTSDGATEYKYYGQGIGVMREVPAVGDELLTSHATN